MINKNKLTKILQNHIHWLEQDCEDWAKMKANLSNADLSNANFSNANLREANLRYADLSEANLRDADLRYADLRGANLRGANLRDADLRGADLREANLSNADLSNANFSNANLICANLSNANLICANLSNADLRGADLSEAKGLKSSIDYLIENFEKCEEGIIVYKTFGGTYSINHEWKIKPGSIISENVNANRTNNCGCGINVAPLDWVKNNYKGDIWKVLIKWEWLCGVVVPYNTDGKIRCERVQLIEIVE